LVVAAVVNNRLPLYVEFKTKRGAAMRGPFVKRSFTDGFNDLRGLTHVIETLAGLLVDVRRRLHPGRMPRGWRKVTRKVRRFFRALAGILVSSGLSDTEKPGGGSGSQRLRLPARPSMGAALTGSAPFQISSERRDTPGADWRSDATGFYD